MKKQSMKEMTKKNKFGVTTLVFLFVMIKMGCISNRKDIIPFVFYRVYDKIMMYENALISIKSTN